MSTLAVLQRRFQRDVLEGGGEMLALLAEPPRGSAARRLAVYADGYRLRLAEALANDFPALRRHLGERRFDELAAEFAVAQPSVHRNLRWYGGALAGFMARRARWRRPAMRVELARFEWAIGLAFDAADAPVLAPQAIAAVPPGRWPSLRFRLHPSVQRLALRSNAPAAWQAAVRGRRKLRPRLARAPAHWLVWRKDFAPFYRRLDADEARALAALARGRDFAAICAVLARSAGGAHAAARGAQLLRNWLAEGLLTAFASGVR